MKAEQRLLKQMTDDRDGWKEAAQVVSMQMLVVQSERDKALKAIEIIKKRILGLEGGPFSKEDVKNVIRELI